MPQADDPVVLGRSVAEHRVLVTNDKDFGELIFRAHQPHVGVLLLRLRDERPPNRVRVVQAVFQRWADRLPNRFTVATEREVRFLPREG
jgi:predicted nuclease of predicted toxin-antitoxin system